MNYLEIIILSIALAIDALLVSFTYGLVLKEERLFNCLKISISFCIFQAFMPILGYFLTNLITNYLINYSKWIVFIIFSIIGIKFIKDALSKEEDNKIICLSFSCLLYLSIATSIDALVAGVSLKLTNSDILISTTIIGGITFILSGISFYISGIFKKLPQRAIMITGATLLLLLAVKNIL